MLENACFVSHQLVSIITILLCLIALKSSLVLGLPAKYFKRCFLCVIFLSMFISKKSFNSYLYMKALRHTIHSVLLHYR